MDTGHVMRELAQASYEMAEADTHERAARALRVKATKRVASIHAEIKAANDAVLELRRKNKSHETPD